MYGKNDIVACSCCHSQGKFKDFDDFDNGVLACSSECADNIRSEQKKGHEPTVFDFVKRQNRRRPLDSALAWAA